MRALFGIVLIALVAVLLFLVFPSGREGGVSDRPHSPKNDTSDLSSMGGVELAPAPINLERAEPVAHLPSEPQSSGAANQPHEGPEVWQQHYANYSLGQIIDERKAIGQEIKAMSESYFTTAFEVGEFVLSPTVQTELGSGVELPQDDLSIVRIEIDTRLGFSKTATLPQEGYEEAYELKRKANWLLDREFEIKHAPVEKSAR